MSSSYDQALLGSVKKALNESYSGFDSRISSQLVSEMDNYLRYPLDLSMGVGMGVGMGVAGDGAMYHQPAVQDISFYPNSLLRLDEREESEREGEGYGGRVVEDPFLSLLPSGSSIASQSTYPSDFRHIIPSSLPEPPSHSHSHTHTHSYNPSTSSSRLNRPPTSISGSSGAKKGTTPSPYLSSLPRNSHVSLASKAGGISNSSSTARRGLIGSSGSGSVSISSSSRKSAKRVPIVGTEEAISRSRSTGVLAANRPTSTSSLKSKR